MTGFLKARAISQIDELLIDGERYTEADIKAIIKQYNIKPKKEKSKK